MWTELKRADGTTMRAYEALPDAAGPNVPSVVLMMHLWGVDKSMQETAHRFAAEGFAIVVPDLYARFEGAPDGDEITDHQAFRPFAQKLTTETIDEDTRAAAAWLRERYAESKMAIAGFCMGGIMATFRSVGYTDLFSAVATWYGLSADVDPAKVEIPVVGSFGMDDAGIPVERVEAFREKLIVPNDIEVYPHAGHAFFDDTRKNFAPKAAEDSWKRTMTFLNEHLSAGS